MPNFETLQKAYRGDKSEPVRLYVVNLYHETFGKDIQNPNCSSCIKDAAIELLVKHKAKNYILHRHEVIFYKGFYFTQRTLTDDIAEKYLKENPGDVVKFKILPLCKF